jgi:hypothetical protein
MPMPCALFGLTDFVGWARLPTSGRQMKHRRLGTATEKMGKRTPTDEMAEFRTTFAAIWMRLGSRQQTRVRRILPCCADGPLAHPDRCA